MKKLLILSIVALIFSGCTSRNEKDTIDFIKNAKKPIRCLVYGVSAGDLTTYTLIDANANVYYTGRTELKLPDTIKVIKYEKDTTINNRN